VAGLWREPVAQRQASPPLVVADRPHARQRTGARGAAAQAQVRGTPRAGGSGGAATATPSRPRALTS
jgi:hypothetical protein